MDPRPTRFGYEDPARRKGDPCPRGSPHDQVKDEVAGSILSTSSTPRRIREVCATSPQRSTDEPLTGRMRTLSGITSTLTPGNEWSRTSSESPVYYFPGTPAVTGRRAGAASDLGPARVQSSTHRVAARPRAERGAQGPRPCQQTAAGRLRPPPRGVRPEYFRTYRAAEGSRWRKRSVAERRHAGGSSCPRHPS